MPHTVASTTPRQQGVRRKKNKKKHRKLRSQKQSAFMMLPGEIRNQVYDLVFDKQRVLVALGYRGECHKSGNPKRMVHYDLPLPGALLSHPTETPFGLLFSCQQVYREASTVFYSKTIFGFGSISSLRSFLSRVPPFAKESIRALELYHSTYGEPRGLRAGGNGNEHRIWKFIHDGKWHQACAQAAVDLKGLQDLKISLAINDCIPFCRMLDDDWALPLRRFQGMDKVVVALKSKRMDSELLRKLEGLLEHELLHDEARRAQAEAKTQRELEERVKVKELNRGRSRVPKTKVLRIVY